MPVLSTCLNPALDREFYINDFQIDSLHRLQAENSKMSPGGKAINVAIDLAAFGIKSIVTGFIGGYVGNIVLNELRKTSNLITTNFVHIDDETRENIVIIDEQSHTITEINSSGPRVPIEDISHFLRRYSLMVSKADAVVISGSIPQGVPKEIYGDLTKIALRHGKKVFWEVTDDILMESLKISVPYILRPDFRKDKVLFGKKLETQEDYIEAGKEAIKYGIKMVVLSYKIDYDIIVTSDGVWFLKPLIEVEHSHLLGTGDIYMATMIYKHFETDDLVEIAKCGYAAALAKTRYKAKVPPTFEDIKKAFEQFKIERVE